MTKTTINPLSPLAPNPVVAQPEPPPSAKPDDIEEIQAFCFIAGYELTLAGQAWTDGTGIIHGATWRLSHPKSHRATQFDGYPSMAEVKRIIAATQNGGLAWDNQW